MKKIYVLAGVALMMTACGNNDILSPEKMLLLTLM